MIFNKKIKMIVIVTIFLQTMFLQSAEQIEIQPTLEEQLFQITLSFPYLSQGFTLLRQHNPELNIPTFHEFMHTRIFPSMNHDEMHNLVLPGEFADELDLAVNNAQNLIIEHMMPIFFPIFYNAISHDIDFQDIHNPIFQYVLHHYNGFMAHHFRNLMRNDFFSWFNYVVVNNCMQGLEFFITIEQNRNFHNALIIAADYNNQEVVQLLLDANANIDVQNNDGNTALHLAVLRNHREIVEMLLQAGASINMINNEEMTPLIVAQRMHRHHIIPMLQQVAALQQQGLPA